MSNKPLTVGMVGENVAALHQALAALGLRIPEAEARRRFFGPGTREAVKQCQARSGLTPSGICDESMGTLLNVPGVGGPPPVPSAIASPPGPFSLGAQVTPGPTIPSGGARGETGKHQVQGRILFDHGLPAGEVCLRVYNRGYGGAETPLGEIKTDAQGGYALSYDPGGKAANIEVRVVDAQGKEIQISDTKFNAEKSEVLNLVAPTTVQTLAPEFHRLSADLIEQVGDLSRLAEAQEHDARPDLTLLHQDTGWDARLIALTTTAVKLGAESGMPHEALYALFRAGLPTDKQQLAWVSPQAVEKALNKAQEAGIVSLDAQQIIAAKASFENFARTTRLETKVPGAVSNFSDMLAKVDLGDDNFSDMLAKVDLGDDKNKFIDLYFEHRGTARELWEKARKAKISEANISKLRFQGKLAYLTLNNADLAGALQQEIGSMDNLSQLVEADLYQADAWKTRLNQMADNDEARQKLIPPAYVSDQADAKENLQERLEAYSEDLARKVRLSYPTQVVRRMIENGPEKGGLSLGENHEAIKTPVHTFLKNAEGLGFELGQTPVDAFIKQNPQGLFRGIAEDQVADTTRNVKTLQRLYQTSPSDASLKVLYKEGFKSAQDIVAFPYETFQERYGHLFPSREEARVVYRKAEQVSVVTYNFFTIAKQLDSAPPVAAFSPPAHIREHAKNELIKHYPTMESLFGSLDFCECEHCRSVLSPAAYFVDLLQFLDPDDLVWKNILDDWSKKHNGKAYDGPDYQYKKPYEALIERRPDLPHLQLTCENTQTALPYIDSVNEILEYYVANDKLTEEAAHDTGDASTAELLAEPQNIIPKAYETLRAARYPLTLPFDFWLETVRRFFDHFETPLWQVLETFRPSDELFSPATDPKPYYRADMFSEYLGLSPAEYEIFTNANLTAKWFEMYGYTSEADALAALKSAKTLSRRLGVSYKELTEIAQTSFVNPQLDDISIIWKLRLGVGNVVQYFKEKDKPEYAEEKKAFEERLEALLKETSSDLKLDDILAKLSDLKGKFQQALVLRDTSALCNFDETYLEYADPSDPSKPYADALVFFKMNLFVRLWKKLGWTMEETDRSLQTFLPKNTLPLNSTNIGAALKTALVYLAHLKNLDERVRVGKNSRLKLLTLWSHLSTTGKNPLYSQLFLARSVLKIDRIFDDPLGNYLSASGIFVKDHLLAVQSALNLTAEDIDRILIDAGTNLDTVALSLDTVSLLYRYGLLAKALKLSVRDLIILKRLSGLDPFKPLNADTLTTLDDDHPFQHTLRFVDIAGTIHESGFTIEDLNYVLRHRFDPVGKYRVAAEVPLALVKLLAAEIRRIQLEHAIPADPLSLTDDLLRQKMALVLPPDVVENFLGAWTSSVVYAVEVNTPPTSKLDPAAFAEESAIHVSYDDVRQKQRLAFRGVLIDTEKQRLKDAHLSPVFSTLLDAVQEQIKPFKEFFQNKLQKYQINDTRAGGFLDASDFDVLFAPLPSIPESLPETEKHARRRANEDVMRQKRKKLAEVFLPFLQRELIRQFVVQTLAANLNADPVLTEALLSETSLLSDPQHPGHPLLDAFACAGERGVSVSFFASPDGTGTALGTKTAGTADTSGKPGEANSARFEGYFEVPAAGAYRFFMVFGKKDAEAELHLITMPDMVMQHKATRDNHEVSEPGDFVELKPGVPYHFVFNACNLGGGDVALLIQGENLPKDSLARLTLYPHAAIERIQYAQLLLAKVLQLILGFEISEREVRYLLTHAADFANLNWSKLPVAEIDDATVLLQQFLRLANYALLKREIASGTDDLISVFETKSPDAIYKRIADLTRRNVKTVQEATKAIALPLADFSNEQGLQRLWKSLQLIENLGISVEAIACWAHIVKIPKTPDDEKARIDIARDVKNTVKARYEPEDWQRIAQPIFDRLRQRQRDALVAYILHRRGFERMEQLFEHFLIDPGMEPVVQTSRMRLAIASVQVFIQRCLLNLEPKVHPSVINSKQWQWMKRYRVWEANRKIFLFPENWLEPEFRDDKTHLFQELESALLQGDVSNDLAEDAFFQYLKKLKELAKLDIVTMYCEEKPDPALNALHVIGRTAHTPHKYFYRRYAHQMWTPWEPVTAEIDGDHIVAVVWRERLHLFWLTFLEKADPNATAVDSIDDNATVAKIAKGVSKAAPVKTVEVQLNWSEYFQGEWTTRESSGFGDPIRKPVGSSFNSSEVFVYVYKEYVGGEERAVRINLTGTINGAFLVVSKNSPIRPDNNSNIYLLELPYPNANRQAIRYAGSNALKVTFVERIEIKEGNPPKLPTQATKEILGQVNDFSLVTCNDVFAFDVEALIKSFPSKRIGTTPYELALAESRAKAMKAYLITSFGIDARSLVAVPLSSWDQLFQWITNVGPTRALPTPFFYQDNLYTFFVEPSFTETTIDRWEEWIITTPPPVFELDDDWWKSLPIVPVVPLPKQPIPMPPIDPRARFGLQPQGDWLTNPATVLQFSDSVIGQVGGLNPQVVVTTGIAASGLGVLNNISPGGMVTPGSVSTIPGISGVAIGSVAPGSVHVVGGSGLSPALIGSIRALTGPSLGQNVSGIESVRGMLNRSIERKA